MKARLNWFMKFTEIKEEKLLLMKDSLKYLENNPQEFIHNGMDVDVQISLVKQSIKGMEEYVRQLRRIIEEFLSKNPKLQTLNTKI